MTRTTSGSLRIEHLGVRIGAARIVNDVSLEVEPGSTLGIVGESGSGKSMTVLAATGLVDSPPARVTGRSLLDGRDLVAMDARRLRAVHGREVSFVFQDPSTSLNPVLTLERQLTEGPEAHLSMTRRAARAKALDLLDAVGIPDPASRLRSYPHQLSGGMKQRVLIAIALACDPKILIADEPTTALDVTTQAQIVALVTTMQERLGMSVVWISHDLAVVGGVADHVAVLYGGQVLEHAPVGALFAEPSHPYTQGLLAARPRLGSDRALVTVPGSPPDPASLPPGCVFEPRCPLRLDERCRTENPPTTEIAPGHQVRSFCATSDPQRSRNAWEGVIA